MPNAGTSSECDIFARSRGRFALQSVRTCWKIMGLKVYVFTLGIVTLLPDGGHRSVSLDAADSRDARPAAWVWKPAEQPGVPAQPRCGPCGPGARASCTWGCLSSPRSRTLSLGSTPSGRGRLRVCEEMRDSAPGGQSFHPKIMWWDFPGGPAVKITHFHCSECGFGPWSGN